MATFTSHMIQADRLHHHEQEHIDNDGARLDPATCQPESPSSLLNWACKKMVYAVNSKSCGQSDKTDRMLKTGQQQNLIYH